VVYAYILLAVGLEMTVWMLPNLFGNVVAFALVGVLMGTCKECKQWGFADLQRD
jgi:hypothetical protein